MPANRGLSPIVRIAPAKVNLTLAVLGRRPDGYHDLHSVMVPVALADRLSLARAHGSFDTVRVAGHRAGPDRDNLVLRAIGAARATLRGQVDAWPIAARLEKAIPVAAGLGGGSSDAAAALDAALEAWSVDTALGPSMVSTIRAELAVRLGSDVPFFLARGPAVVTGRGEVVDALPGLRGSAPGLLLVTPAFPAATSAVFAALDHDAAARPTDGGSTRAASQHLAAEWRAGLRSSALLVRAGVLASANDLAPAADVVVPGLRALRRTLARLLGRPVGLSGSGPTLWVLYASRAEAATAAEAVEAGVADGSIVAPGSAGPSIIATTIAAEDRAPNRPEEDASP
ncbi:MAG: hypothetical protein V4515_09595 [Chloroflexota bacterium]